MNEVQWTHRMPKAPVVDRLQFLREFVAGKRVIHLGFADIGCRGFQEEMGSWLHAHLARTAKELVGIDLDEEGVETARREGYEAYAADCQDPQVLRRLGISPAEVVVAGELIEHLDTPGPFLDAMHYLVTPSGTLVVTTPNAYSLLNPMAALRRYEVVNPDHVALYSWYTLTNVLARHGWRVQRFLTYLLPPIGSREGRSSTRRLDVAAARALLAAQRFLARYKGPFVADGLIAVCSKDPP